MNYAQISEQASSGEYRTLFVKFDFASYPSLAPHLEYASHSGRAVEDGLAVIGVYLGCKYDVRLGTDVVLFEIEAVHDFMLSIPVSFIYNIA